MDEDRNDTPRGIDDVRLSGDFRDMAEQFMRLLQEDDEREALTAHAEDEAMAESDRLRADRARAGELGPEWRAVQARIDLGQTTLEAVFSGEDTSTEAERLRELSNRNLTALRDSWSESDDEDEHTAPTPDEIFEQTLVESRQRYEDAAQRIHDALQALNRIE
jgi:hypothetical protein